MTDKHDIPTEVIANLLDTLSERLPNLIDTISEKLPKLISGIRDTIFSPDAGRDIGNAVANFYHALIEKGIPGDTAASLTSDYLHTLTNIGKNLKLRHD